MQDKFKKKTFTVVKTDARLKRKTSFGENCSREKTKNLTPIKIASAYAAWKSELKFSQFTSRVSS